MADIKNYKVLLTIFKEYDERVFPMEMAVTRWMDSDGNTYITDEPLVELCMRLTLFVYLHNNTQDMRHMQTEDYLYEDMHYCRTLLEKRSAKLRRDDRFRILYTVFSRRFELFELLFRANDILFFWLSQIARPFKTERDMEEDVDRVKKLLKKMTEFRLPEKFKKCIGDRFKLPDPSSGGFQHNESDWKITINKLHASFDKAMAPRASFEKSAELSSISGRIFNSTWCSTSTFFYGQTTFLTPSEVQIFYESASAINAKLKSGVFRFDKSAYPPDKRPTTLTIKKPFPKFSLWIEDPLAYLRSVRSRLLSVLPCC